MPKYPSDRVGFAAFSCAIRTLDTGRYLAGGSYCRSKLHLPKAYSQHTPHMPQVISLLHSTAILASNIVVMVPGSTLFHDSFPNGKCQRQSFSTMPYILATCLSPCWPRVEHHLITGKKESWRPCWKAKHLLF